MVIGLDMPAWLYTTITIIGAVSVIAAVLLTKRQVTTARQAAAAATRNQRKAYEDVLVPIVALLDDIVSSTGSERARLKQQMKLSIVTLVAQLVGNHDTRACLLEEVRDATGRRELQCKNHLWSGRGEPPTETFSADDERGRKLLELYDKGQDIFIRDVDELSESLRPDGEKYKTYINASVKVRDRSLGVLTVDSLNRGDLNQDDVSIVAVLARLLGVALAVGR
ncbi:hypothetical protein CCS38_31240 [Streptomyces purpurogeneiscleroticus]|nr:hypothetical protein [Streptomyces purpurogeneiscleroticus]